MKAAREEKGPAQEATPPAAGDGGHLPGLPSLPPGHGSQVAWGFNSPIDGAMYEFYRVYRQPEPLNGLGPIWQLDRDLSYWLTISFSPDDPTHQHPRWRSVSYRQARERAGPKLSFERFSSSLLMRDDTTGLLQAA